MLGEQAEFGERQRTDPQRGIRLGEPTKPSAGRGQAIGVKRSGRLGEGASTGNVGGSSDADCTRF